MSAVVPEDDFGSVQGIAILGMRDEHDPWRVVIQAVGMRLKIRKESVTLESVIFHFSL